MGLLRLQTTRLCYGCLRSRRRQVMRNSCEIGSVYTYTIEQGCYVIVSREVWGWWLVFQTRWEYSRRGSNTAQFLNLYKPHRNRHICLVIWWLCEHSHAFFHCSRSHKDCDIPDYTSVFGKRQNTTRCTIYLLYTFRIPLFAKERVEWRWNILDGRFLNAISGN